MSLSNQGNKRISTKNLKHSSIPNSFNSKATSSKKMSQMTVTYFNPIEEINYMPNFVENFNDLILEIKSKTKPSITENNIPIDLDLKRTKTGLNPVVDHHKIENMITNIQKDDVKSLTNIEEIRDFYDYTENCLKLISTLKRPNSSDIESMKINLPEELTVTKKLVIFDLDETLIHCELKNISEADKVIDVKMPSGKEVKVSIFLFIMYRLD
jgi:hypothetical protein